MPANPPHRSSVRSARALRNRRQLPSLPVVIATGRPDFVDSVTERGGIALMKPYSLEWLEAGFTKHLSVDVPPPTSGAQPKAA